MIMERLWMILLLFLVCTEAKNRTEVKVELGQNVTLTCSVSISNIYWYMEIHRRLRGCILRTFSVTDNKPTYCSPNFKTKYSILENRLVISNVTAEDCRLYFCARKQDDIIHFEDTICLTAISITPSTNNPEPNNQQQQHIQRVWQSEPLIFSSFALNVLFVVIIGLFFTSLCLKRKNSKYQVNEPSPLTSENSETLETPQYEEIQLRVPPPAAHSDCIYYKAQLPRSMLPEHLNVT